MRLEPARKQVLAPPGSAAERSHHGQAPRFRSSPDSPLEGAGFEPSVPPRERRPRRGPAADHRRLGRRLSLMTPSSLSVRHLPSATAEGPFANSGTDGSNPVPSTGESVCATHDTELGGASPLRAARSGTASQRQLRRSDAGWGGSRRQNGGPTNRKRIQGQRGGATRPGTGTPDTPSVHRTGRSDGRLGKVQCLTVGDLPGSPGEPQQGIGDGIRRLGRSQPRQ